MLTAKDFTELYRKYSDEELAELYTNIKGYSEEAKVAIYTVIYEKGGINRLSQSLKDKLIIEREISRIKNETTRLCSKETSADFIKNLVTSTILAKTQVDEIIEKVFAEFTFHLNQNPFDLKTVFLAALGIIFSSVFAAILWNLLITESDKIPVNLILLIPAMCYFTIILFTRKSKTNPLVIVSTIIATMLSIFIRDLLF